MPSSLLKPATSVVTLFGLAILCACDAACDARAPANEAKPAAANASASGASAPTAAASAAASMPMSKTADDAKERGGGDKPADTWKRSRVTPNATRLMVGEREEIPLKNMQAKVTIDGFRARVVIDYYFVNERSSAHEGTFQLRLPEEASPYFFAFGESTYQAPAPSFVSLQAAQKMGADPAAIMSDRAASWTLPKEARMVPREKAAFAYAETTRRRVDPALVEWAGAGVFNARVFPLAANKMHHIVVGYDVDLTKVGADLEYRLDLPEKPSVVDVSVAEMPNVAIATAPQAPSAQIAGRAMFRFENPKDKTITVRLKEPGPTLLTGADSKTGAHFAADFTFEPGDAAAAASADRAVFLVDTSLSSNPDKLNVWLKLLGGVLEKNRDSLKKFAVEFFNVETFWWRPELTDNTPENVAALLAFASGLALEGATDIGAALKQAGRPSWMSEGEASHRWDTFLLSDAAATWGESDPYAISRGLAAQRHPLFAYRTGLEGSDVALMNHLARESGGAVFTVASESDLDKAATAHRARPWQLVSAAVDGGSDLLFAGRPKTLFPGQHLQLVGRGAPSGDVALTVSRDGRSQVVRTKLGRAVRSELAPRIYGQIAVGQLEELEGATEAASKAYATHFRVTGRTSSLLMLESEQDYQRFGIHPEQDASLIAETPASSLVARTLQAIGDTLGDPKASFVAFVKKLGQIPGVTFNPPEAFRAAIERMPGAAFDVASEPLATQRHDRAGVSPALLERLAKHDVDYDAISAEARARKEQLGPADALKALSSLVEQSPGDAVLARDVGFSAMELGLKGQAFHLFRRVAAARPFEPQTYRGMAQALTAMGRTDLAMAYYELGLIGQWDARFGDLRAIFEVDYLRFLRRIANGQLESSVAGYASARLEELARSVSMQRADLVVMITWNTDNTDVDLHVTEPSGEECFYSHRTTRSGGELTRDVTQGYGPEMYVMKKAPRGSYRVTANYFSSNRNRASARTKVYATVFENWGTPEERVTEKVVTLEDNKQVHEIAVISR